MFVPDARFDRFHRISSSAEVVHAFLKIGRADCADPTDRRALQLFGVERVDYLGRGRQVHVGIFLISLNGIDTTILR